MDCGGPQGTGDHWSPRRKSLYVRLRLVPQDPQSSSGLNSLSGETGSTSTSDSPEEEKVRPGFTGSAKGAVERKPQSVDGTGKPFLESCIPEGVCISLREEKGSAPDTGEF
ncbi:unnamed protein product [Caretta caretta]